MFGIVASISDNGMAVSRAPGAPPAGSRCRWGGRAGGKAAPGRTPGLPAAGGVDGPRSARLPAPLLPAAGQQPGASAILILEI